MEDEKPFTAASPFDFSEKGDVVFYYNDSSCKLICANPTRTPRGSTRGVPVQNKNTSSGSLRPESSIGKMASRNACFLAVLTVLTVVALFVAIASLTLSLLLLLRVIPLQELSGVTPTAAPPTNNATSSDSPRSGPTVPSNLPSTSPCNCTHTCTGELHQILEVQERLNISIEQMEDLMVMFDMLDLSLRTLAKDIHTINSSVTSLQNDATRENDKVDDETSTLSNLSLPAVLREVQAYSNCSTVKATSCTTSSSLYTGTIPSFKYCETPEVPILLSSDVYNLDVTCAVEESSSRAPIVATLEVSEQTGNMRCLCYVVVTSTGTLGPNNLGCNMYVTSCPTSQSLQVTIDTN